MTRYVATKMRTAANVVASRHSAAAPNSIPDSANRIASAIDAPALANRAMRRSQRRRDGTGAPTIGGSARLAGSFIRGLGGQHGTNLPHRRFARAGSREAG